jgi:DNA repair protein RecO (recombination protein O)
MKVDSRVDHQPAFVLHAYPWRETSAVVETLTRDYGRMALVARGAKRPTSQFRGILMPFSPLSISWSGRGELKTLVRAEWQGGLAPLRGDGLLKAFYLNELLVRLLPRADAHPGLFGSYLVTLAQLARAGAEGETALRGFELDLLRELGVAPSFDACVDGDAVDPQGIYLADFERGFRRATDLNSHADPDALSGATLIALARHDFSDSRTLPAARALLRRLIGYHLDGKPLNARRILMDLRSMS